MFLQKPGTVLQRRPLTVCEASEDFITPAAGIREDIQYANLLRILSNLYEAFIYRMHMHTKYL